MNDNVKLQERFYESWEYTDDFRLDERIKIVLEMMPNGKGKLLDIGCSDGRISNLFKEKGYDVYGVDISEKALERANERGIKVTKADITNRLPYKDAEFDVVFCGEVLDVVLEPMILLKDIYRVLKPNAEFLLGIVNISMLKNIFLIFAGSLPYGASSDGTVVRNYCKKTLVEILVKTGFKNIKVRGDRMSIPYASQRDISIPPIIPRFCNHLIVRCKK